MSEQEIAQPRCPYCEHQPLQFGQNAMQTPTGAIVSAIWCGTCGTVLNISQVGQQAPKIVDPTSNGNRVLVMQ